MKLYFYYLEDNGNTIGKIGVAGIRENRSDYAIPAGRKFPFHSFRDWNLSKECCNIIQVNSELYKRGPFIVSEKDNLENIPRLAEMFIAVSESCTTVNNQIKGIAENE